jgi:hypothetical protein
MNRRYFLNLTMLFTINYFKPKTSIITFPQTTCLAKSALCTIVKTNLIVIATFPFKHIFVAVVNINLYIQMNVYSTEEIAAMMPAVAAISAATVAVFVIWRNYFLKGFTKRNVMTQHTEWVQIMAT